MEVLRSPSQLQPPGPEHPREQRAGVGRRHDEQPSRPEDAPNLPQLEAGVVKVLDHVEHGDAVERGVGVLQRVHRAVADLVAHVLVRPVDSVLVELHAVRVPTRQGGHLDEEAQAAAQVEKPARRPVGLDAPENLAQPGLYVVPVAQVVHVAEVGVVVGRLEGGVLEVVLVVEALDVVHRRSGTDVAVAAAAAPHHPPPVHHMGQTGVVLPAHRADHVDHRFHLAREGSPICRRQATCRAGRRGEPWPARPCGPGSRDR